MALSPISASAGLDKTDQLGDKPSVCVLTLDVRPSLGVEREGVGLGIKGNGGG